VYNVLKKLYIMGVGVLLVNFGSWT